jgi:hypothetical protein
MNRTHVSFGALALAVTLSLPLTAAAQLGKSLAGTSWTLVSNEMTDPQGAKRTIVEGKDIKGALTFSNKGCFSYVVIANVPKLAGDRLVSTPAEDHAIARGSLAYFGTYSVDDATGTLTINIERSTFPTQNGTTSKRKLTLKGNELTVENEARTKGGTTKVVWKKD